MQEYISLFMMFFLIMDPVGNLPVFIKMLEDVPESRFRHIVIRESCIALGIMIFFMVAGGRLLGYLGLSQASIELAGGIILFLIALKMVFGGTAGEEPPEKHPNRKEPFIVPLAIPFIAGPAMLSTCILQGGRGWLEMLAAMPALLTAWMLSSLILATGTRIERLLGPKLVAAMEALMGLLLVAISAEMLIRGIKMAFSLK